MAGALRDCEVVLHSEVEVTLDPDTHTYAITGNWESPDYSDSEDAEWTDQVKGWMSKTYPNFRYIDLSNVDDEDLTEGGQIGFRAYSGGDTYPGKAFPGVNAYLEGLDLFGTGWINVQETPEDIMIRLHDEGEIFNADLVPEFRSACLAAKRDLESHLEIVKAYFDSKK
jgi:hypothetical protein